MPFTIAELSLRAGLVGICPMPGSGGFYASDLALITRWSPDLVITMTPMEELRDRGGGDLPADMARLGVEWHHLPVADFGTPSDATNLIWPKTSVRAGEILASGGRVLAHCLGGCGRSGMALLRLMVEAGESPDEALIRLRTARPCAVETDAQRLWASGGGLA